MGRQIKEKLEIRHQRTNERPQSSGNTHVSAIR
jgi:hypothetical protein